ncbi:MAG: Xaa-Pro peptidase family protein [Candidatus Omnitrophota bacterium]
MNSKLKDIYRKLDQEGLDALLVISAANISYLAGFPAQDAYLLISVKKNIYFTDSRYLNSAAKNLLGCGLKEINTDAFDRIINTCAKLGLKKVGFEKDYLTFTRYQELRGGPGIELTPVCGFVEELRQVKDAEELRKIRIAADLARKALKYIKDIIVPGKREIEVAGELERILRYAGASKSSFDIIVASGPNSSFPHYITGKRKIRDNEPVLVDVGADYLGYKSDLTRVFISGKIDTLYRKIQEIVFKARDLAIQQIRPGKKAQDIDSASRSYIAKKGFGKYFVHSLGHGLGLEVHEGPRLSPKNGNVLKAGMVLTVEPAIYIPGKFGSRVEDMVIVTRNGCEVL